MRWPRPWRMYTCGLHASENASCIILSGTRIIKVQVSGELLTRGRGSIQEPRADGATVGGSSVLCTFGAPDKPFSFTRNKNQHPRYWVHQEYRVLHGTNEPVLRANGMISVFGETI